MAGMLIFATPYDERRITLAFMNRHGPEVVRGDVYQGLRLDDDELREIRRAQRHELDLCLHCGSEEHWAKECPSRQSLCSRAFGVKPLRKLVAWATL
jgi:hypothetical protein